MATPPTAATVEVPESTPPPGLVPMATVTSTAEPVTVLSYASRIVRTTAGLMAAPATTAVGWVVNVTWVAAPGVTLKPPLVVPTRALPVAVRV